MSRLHPPGAAATVKQGAHVKHVPDPRSRESCWAKGPWVDVDEGEPGPVPLTLVGIFAGLPQAANDVKRAIESTARAFRALRFSATSDLSLIDCLVEASSARSGEIR